MQTDASHPDDPVREDSGDARAMSVLDRKAASVSEARAWLLGFLRDQGAPDRLSEDAVLVMSELVTNALRHGMGQIVARGSFSSAGVLRLAVTDSGSELPAMQAIEPGRVGGVGLQIVDRLASRWGISPFPGGKTVWAIFGSPGPT